MGCIARIPERTEALDLKCRIHAIRPNDGVYGIYPRANRSIESDGEGDTFVFPEVFVDKVDGEDTAFDFGASGDTASACARSKGKAAIGDDLEADLGPAAFGGFDGHGATAGEVVGFGEASAFWDDHCFVLGELCACSVFVEKVDGRPKCDAVDDVFGANEVAVDDVEGHFALFDGKAGAECAFGFVAKNLDAVVCSAQSDLVSACFGDRDGDISVFFEGEAACNTLATG